MTFRRCPRVLGLGFFGDEAGMPIIAELGAEKCPRGSGDSTEPTFLSPSVYADDSLTSRGIHFPPRANLYER